MKNTLVPELDLYEDPSFPFVMFIINQHSCTPPGPGYHYLHWHEDLQFTIVTKGSMSMMVNGKDYTLKKNDAIFINSGLLHMTNHISDDGEYISFNYPPRMLSILYGSKMESEFVHHFTMNYNLPAIALSEDNPWQNKIIHMLLDLYDFCKNKTVYAKEYEIAIRLELLWLSFIRHVKEEIHLSSKTFVRKQQSMQMMLTFIHEHFMYEISLTDIAESSHISQAECCRLFKTLLNTSPYRYLVTYRIHKSMDLLKQTNDSVMQIATKVGFNDSSHYIQLFKQFTGKTPHIYRKTI